MPWRRQLSAYFPLPLVDVVSSFPQALADEVREIRIRAGKTVEWVCSPGAPIAAKSDWIPCAQDIAQLAQGFMQHSAYAHQHAIQQGYVTVGGGHRIGICGRAVMEGHRLIHITEICSLCIRITRPIAGVADWLMPYLASPKSTLIFSKPGMGKTTILRDTIRQLSDSFGHRVCVVDERSEIAGYSNGSAQMDVGAHTDVLDACPKAVGMMLLLRAMAPTWLAVDEIGCTDDVEAVQESARCGVPVLATSHAGNLEQLLARPIMRPLAESATFDQYVELGPNASMVGIWDVKGHPV